MSNYLYPTSEMTTFYRKLMNGARLGHGKSIKTRHYVCEIDSQVPEFLGLAQRDYMSIRDLSFVKDGLIEVYAPLPSKDFLGWTVKVVPTMKLVDAVEVLEKGLVFDIDASKACYAATEEWIRDWMLEGPTTTNSEFFEVANRICEYPEFSRLSADLAAFRIAAVDVGGRFEVPHGIDLF